MSVDFTVVIPTYNGKSRLPKVLEYLQSQTNIEILNWEIIIVDNNSHDGTAELVQKYQINWSFHVPLRYCFEAEQGAGFARNRGITEAKGELVGFLDDDNLPAKNWVLSAYKFGQEHLNAGAYGSQIHGLFEVEPSEDIKPILFYLAINERGEKSLRYEPSKKGFPPSAGLVVRRNIWKNNVPSRLLLGGRVGNSLVAYEDFEALSYIYKAGWEIWYNPAMEVEHIIPSWRIERKYLISLMRGIGLGRYYLRMLFLKNWQKPFVFSIYMVSDIYKFISHLIRYHKVLQHDIIAACEMERLLGTLISPFYLCHLKISRFLKIKFYPSFNLK
ncbi:MULTISPECIES: hormogonium polysaccharide biosynthesis glycosyltransferase HpsE [unclassified Tolypothrix]|uniref:hormogonium polysaccharide biosynthesis glycosyltransferase HpsE n=1 Tax=unclassified Tolypothrix TaxID=2649714 RepID=UPI0005EAB7F7|nr:MULTISPECIES: hormogonium polysaccharide biosynthesis glycosyltransferase HpsE [unclassified Tolypothrix]BAY88567.1 glycosyl transferase family protein [Microchaete diplosiphon NIES-3275]EKE97148.1 glycosyltransferase, group 2 family protein [Tolypothrix sp. PCC 7601]MBE9082677.1 glycosyltransferase family 2 protein [Tolypothrix sp. LEGE 11397]UYD29240.1 glycosyltransferase family 2 protein [Tolypothrix sp. PCC 7712]UYD34848.1 glycosyltransferase family 2 protein [Tolypothrix sp. PCC 7601]